MLFESTKQVVDIRNKSDINIYNTDQYNNWDELRVYSFSWCY